MKSQFTADFSANTTTGCAPFVVKFTDLSSTGATQWQWTSTAGLVSSIKNPTLIFTQAGVYSVTLVSSNGTSSDTITKEALIRVLPSIKADFGVKSSVGCLPMTIQFNDLSVPQSSAIKSWLWSFGNGATSTQQNPTTTFDEANSYDVFLKITDGNGCEATAYKEKFITAGGPKADFLFDSLTCNLPAKVTFLSTSTGTNLNYAWDFGNGNTSTAPIPSSVTYTEYDTIPIKLKVTEGNTTCSDSIIKNLYIRNYPIDFDFSVECSNADFTVTVSDKTIPMPESVKWNFGDGSESFNSSVKHTYIGNSEATITLNATLNSSCSNSKTIKYQPTVPSFTYTSPASCLPPFIVNFSNASIGSGLNYAWDFGDSTFSSEVNPVHNYDIPPAEYVATLTVTDSMSCLRTTVGNIKPNFPIADLLTSGKTSGCVPFTTTFTNTSYNLSSPISFIKWDFGDPASGVNNTSTDSIASHIYNDPGNYDVSLILVLQNGCTDTVTYNKVVTAGILPASVDFKIVAKDTICYGEELNFEPIVNYTNPLFEASYFCWAFEDSSIAMMTDNETPPFQCPNKISAYLDYNLFVNDPNPHHKFSTYKYINPDTLGGFAFIGETQPSAKNLYSHLFVGFNGCYQEVIKPLYVYPTVAMPGFGFNDNSSSLIVCDSARTIALYNASLNYDSLLFFHLIEKATGDTLAKISENDTLYYNFNKPGDYNVEISVFNKTSNCTDFCRRKIQVINSNTGFKFDQFVCLNDSPFIALDTSSYSAGIYSSRIWKINNSVESSASFPSVKNDTLFNALPDSGWHTVSLNNSIRIKDDIFGPTSFNRECFYTKTDSIYAHANYLTIEFDTLIACKGDSITLKNKSTSTSTVNNYTWFSYPGGSMLGSNKNIKVAQNNTGYYQYKLLLSNTFGCTDSILSDSTLVSFPSLNFTAPDTVACVGDLMKLENKSKGNNVNYTWNLDTLSYTNVDVFHIFQKSGYFDVELVGVDQYGCSDSITKTKFIRIADYPNAAFMGDSLFAICPPFSINFMDTTKANINKWKWSFGDGKSATTENFIHTYVLPGKYDVSLIVTSAEGCTDTILKPKYVTVKGPSANVYSYFDTICAPEDVKFKMDLTDVLYYVWDFGDDTLKTFINTVTLDSTIHNYTYGGIFEPILTVIDSNDCSVTLFNLPEIYSDSVMAKFDNSVGAICKLENYQFKNQSKTYFDATYSWNFGGSNSSVDTNPIFTFDEAKTYPIKLVVETSIGCKDSVQINIPVYEAPYEVLDIKNNNFCVPVVSDYVLRYTNPDFDDEYTYFTYENTVIAGDSVRLNFSTAGEYNLSYHIEYGGGKCIIDSNLVETYYEYPNANFSYLPKYSSVNNSIVVFSNTSTHSTAYQWTFGDGDTLYNEEPSHTYNNYGKYLVQLVAFNPGGCTDTMKVFVPIAPSDLIKLPNAFSPDGDGVNDVFGILYAGEVTLYLFEIYNRWGNVIFETNQLNSTWDGTYKGEPQNHGTYVYYVMFKDEEGNTFEYKGNFSLIR